MAIGPGLGTRSLALGMAVSARAVFRLVMHCTDGACEIIDCTGSVSNAPRRIFHFSSLVPVASAELLVGSNSRQIPLKQICSSSSNLNRSAPCQAISHAEAAANLGGVPKVEYAF